MSVQVLLSTYNGERYLREQLDSLAAQTLAEHTVLVRDDGSSDTTTDLLRAAQDAGELRWFAGGHLGCARSFWQLLCDAGDATFYAWCDQDDVWDATKLEVAVHTLQSLEPGPALYCSDVRVVDAELHPLADHMVRPMPADYPHALVRNLAPGCTFVMNRTARELLCRYDFKTLGIDLHDWFAFQVISCFGQVVYDPYAHLSYRQHGSNAIGAVRNQRLERLRKVPRFLLGSQRNSRERAARRLLQAYGTLMTPDQRERTEDVACYRSDPHRRLRLLRSSDLRLGLADRMMLDALAILGRL